MPTDDEDALSAQLAAWRAEEEEAKQHLLREIADYGEANANVLLQAVIASVPVWQEVPDQEEHTDGR